MSERMSRSDREARLRMGSVLVRGAHLIAVSPLAGVYLLGADAPSIHGWWLLAGASGLLLLVVEIVRHPGLHREGTGLAVLLKLVLVGTIPLAPAAAGWLAGAGIAVAAVGAHAPRKLRHRRIL